MLCVLYTAGLVSLAKILISFEDGMIPATTNLLSPSISTMVSGQLEVVTENTRMIDGVAAVNSLGWGGYHVHTILLANDNTRIVPYLASEKQRLCLYASTTDHAVEKMLKVRKIHSELFEHLTSILDFIKDLAIK